MLPNKLTYLLTYLLTLSGCATKKTDKEKSPEPAQASQTASTSDSYSKVASDVRQTLSSFVSQNQSSSDPTTQKFLALAEETLAKQSASDLTKALADDSFEAKSAVAEFDAEAEAEESSVGKNLAIGSTALGGVIFIIGVSGGLYYWKTTPKDLLPVLEAYAERKRAKITEFNDAKSQLKTTLSNSGIYIYSANYPADIEARSKATPAQKQAYREFVQRFYKPNEIRNSQKYVILADRLDHMLEIYQKKTFFQDKIEVIKFDPKTMRVAGYDDSAVYKSNPESVALFEQLKKKVPIGTSKEEAGRVIGEIMHDFMKKEKTPEDWKKNADMERDQICKPAPEDQPRRAFTQAERTFAVQNYDAKKGLAQLDANEALKGTFQYRLAELVESTFPIGGNKEVLEYENKILHLIMTDEAVFNQFKKRFESYEALFDIKPGEVWDLNKQMKARFVNSTILGTDVDLENFFTYNPYKKEFGRYRSVANNDITAALKLKKISDPIQLKRARLAAFKKTAAAGAIVTLVSGGVLAGVAASSGGSKKSDDGLQLTDQTSSKHPVIQLLEDLESLRNRVTSIKATQTI